MEFAKLYWSNGLQVTVLKKHVAPGVLGIK